MTIDIAALLISLAVVLTFAWRLGVTAYREERARIAAAWMAQRTPTRVTEYVRDCAGGGDPFPLELIMLPLDDRVSRAHVAIDLAAMRALDAADCEAP